MDMQAHNFKQLDFNSIDQEEMLLDEQFKIISQS